jgi:hypothetical protein
MPYFFILLRYHTSTCFGPICSPSSEGQVYNVANGTCITSMLTAGMPGTPTVDLEVIRTKNIPIVVQGSVK